MNDNITKIKKEVQYFEKILNQTDQLIKELDELTEQFQMNEVNYRSLLTYYGSDSYHQAKDLSEESDELQDIECGVLSEDAVFNLISDHHELAIKLLQTATMMLQVESD